MASITTRVDGTGETGVTVKNSPLSNSEIDTNFINLNNDKLELSDAVSTNTANSVVLRDGSGNFAAGAITLGTALALSSGGTGATSASAARTSLGLVIGTNVQAYDRTLQAIANSTDTGVLIRTADTTTGITTSYSPQLTSLGIGTAASGVSTDSIRAVGTITAYYSDERLKTDIVEIPNALEKVNQLRGVTYRANEIAESFGYDASVEQVGVLAGEVEKVLPQVVVPAPFDRMIYEGVDISKSGQNYKTVHYEKLIPLLIQAINELSEEVNLLKSK